MKHFKERERVRQSLQIFPQNSSRNRSKNLQSQSRMWNESMRVEALTFGDNLMPHSMDITKSYDQKDVIKRQLKQINNNNRGTKRAAGPCVSQSVTLEKS